MPAMTSIALVSFKELRKKLIMGIQLNTRYRRSIIRIFSDKKSVTIHNINSNTLIISSIIRDLYAFVLHVVVTLIINQERRGYFLHIFRNQ